MAGSGGVGGLGPALYFMRQEDKRIREMLGRHRRRIERKARRMASDQAAYRSRLDDAESDLGRTLLLAMAVNRTLVAKGVLSTNEISKSLGSWIFPTASKTENVTPPNSVTLAAPNAIEQEGRKSFFASWRKRSQCD